MIKRPSADAIIFLVIFHISLYHAFSGQIPPAGGIKAVLGQTVKITSRKQFRVDHNPANKFDTPDTDGKVTKYVVITEEPYSALVKGETIKVSSFFASQSHYDQLKNLVPDGKSETLDKMFEDGKISPEIVPCKVKGGTCGKYFTWLTPEAHAKAQANGDLYKE